ncbi:MAG: preprotein translocase subunit SecG [bacterium]|nr:preprotein translocase subunit SecG [bacterium]
MSVSVILSIVQIIIAALLVTTVLLQQIGGGLGSAFGGGGASYHSKRGFEKILFTTTIVLGVLFGLTALLALIIQ